MFKHKYKVIRCKLAGRRLRNFLKTKFTVFTHYRITTLHYI